jgi:hypothetical protein
VLIAERFFCWSAINNDAALAIGVNEQLFGADEQALGRR